MWIREYYFNSETICFIVHFIPSQQKCEPLRQNVRGKTAEVVPFSLPRHHLRCFSVPAARAAV